MDLRPKNAIDVYSKKVIAKVEKCIAKGMSSLETANAIHVDYLDLKYRELYKRLKRDSELASPVTVMRASSASKKKEGNPKKRRCRNV